MHTCIKQQKLEHYVITSYVLVMTTKRTANLLGALALTCVDQMKTAAERRLGQGGETPAALTTIGHVPGLSVDTLRRIVGLTHSGAVRLLGRLTSEGLVERRNGQDGRTLALHLTAEGARLRRELIKDRTKPLEAALSKLPRHDLRRFDDILQKLLYQLCQN